MYVFIRSCLALCGPMDCSPSGPPFHGIFQARILEWVALSYSRGFSQPRDWTRVSYVFCIGKRILYHWRHLGSPDCFADMMQLCNWWPSLRLQKWAMRKSIWITRFRWRWWQRYSTFQVSSRRGLVSWARSLGQCRGVFAGSPSVGLGTVPDHIVSKPDL